MSRSGYIDFDPTDRDEMLTLGRWRGIIASAIRGKRGQRMLRDLRAALEALPERKLVTNRLVEDDGCVCTLGALAKARGVDLSAADDAYDQDGDAEELGVTLGEVFDVAPQLAQEVMYWNDEAYWSLTPERRWKAMHDWICENIREAPTP